MLGGQELTFNAKPGPTSSMRFAEKMDPLRKIGKTDANAEIMKLKNIHEHMINYLIMNPTARLKDLASEFNYSVAWVCQITRSDIFRARWEEKAEEISHPVMSEIIERMHAQALHVVDRIDELIPHAQNIEELEKIAKNRFEALGFIAKRGPSVNINSPGPTQVVQVGVAPAGLAQHCRNLMDQKGRVALEGSNGSDNESRRLPDDTRREGPDLVEARDVSPVGSQEEKSQE